MNHLLMQFLRTYLPSTIRLCLALLLFIIPSILKAGTIEIEWDPPLTGDVAGYKVYYGTSSGSYQYTWDVGPATSCTLTDLADCTIFYWAIKAYNASGQESEKFSNELSGMSRPMVSTLNPVSGVQGDVVDLTISGANFATSPTLESNNPGIKVVSVSQHSCNEMAATIQIDPMSRGIKPALIGAHDFTVVNPDAVFGTKEDAFTIILNTTRIDIDLSGRIDGMDLNRLAIVFGISESDGLYNPDCDFDGDGWIDGDDLAYLASHFGESF